MTRRRWLAVLIVAALAVAAAVILFAPDRTEAPGTPPSTSAAPDAAPAMRVQAIVYRTDEAVGGRFRVKITNTGDERFEVLGVRLQSGGFEPVPLTTDPVRYAPGERTDIVTPYGKVRCAEGATADPAFAVMDVRVDGAVQRYEMPMESIYDALDKLHRRECQAASIVDAVSVALADPLTPANVEGELVVPTRIVFERRSGQEPLVVSDVRGSVMYRLLAPELPVTMAASDQSVEVSLTIVVARCDGHALGETKKPFAFPLRMRLGDAEEIGYEIPLTTAQQDTLYEYLATACGLVN